MTNHFLLLVLLGSLLYIAGRVVGTGGSAQDAVGAALSLPGFLFDVLPVIAGLAIVTARPSRATLGHARRLAVIVPIMMLFLDSGVGPAAFRAQVRRATGGSSDEIPPALRTDEVVVDAHGSLGAVAQLLRSGEIAHVPETPDRADFDAPRVVAIRAGQRLLDMTLPVILIGIALGIIGWLHRRVRFEREIDGRMAQLIIGWTIVPLVVFMVSSWRVSTTFAAIFNGSPLGTVLIPYIPFGIVAAVGWRSASQAMRDMDP